MGGDVYFLDLLQPRNRLTLTRCRSVLPLEVAVSLLFVISTEDHASTDKAMQSTESTERATRIPGLQFPSAQRKSFFAPTCFHGSEGYVRKKREDRLHACSVVQCHKQVLFILCS